ncbi:hypothetical protein [Mycoplasmopsis arginini]|nr:hypothetical protein [Mycoplasmopsis arginini]
MFAFHKIISNIQKIVNYSYLILLNKNTKILPLFNFIFFNKKFSKKIA